MGRLGHLEEPCFHCNLKRSPPITSHSSSLPSKYLRPCTQTPRAGTERRARRRQHPRAQRSDRQPARRSTSRAIPSTSRDTSRQRPCGPPRPTRFLHAAVPVTSPLLLATWPAAQPLGARRRPVLGASPAGPQAPPCSAPLRPSWARGEGLLWGYVVAHSAKAGELERLRGCKVSLPGRVGGGGRAQGSDRRAGGRHCGMEMPGAKEDATPEAGKGGWEDQPWRGGGDSGYRDAARAPFASTVPEGTGKLPCFHPRSAPLCGAGRGTGRGVREP